MAWAWLGVWAWSLGLELGLGFGVGVGCKWGVGEIVQLDYGRLICCSAWFNRDAVDLLQAEIKSGKIKFER